MAADVTFLLADPGRITQFRDNVRLPGRVQRFSTLNLPSVFDAIKANQPGLVAIDAIFAQTAEGQAFVDRVQKLAMPHSEIRLVARVGAEWATTPLSSGAIAVPAGAILDAPAAALVDVKASGLNTRRTPRFPVRDALQAVVENGKAGLVDMSVRGAQVLSAPRLRPNQTLKIALPDDNATLRLTAQVAWSLFEKPNDRNEPYYRAGMEFTDASLEALEDYCRRHCGENPIPYRGR
jgi:hypothetical protein